MCLATEVFPRDGLLLFHVCSPPPALVWFLSPEEHWGHSRVVVRAGAYEGPLSMYWLPASVPPISTATLPCPWAAAR